VKTISAEGAALAEQLGDWVRQQLAERKASSPILTNEIIIDTKYIAAAMQQAFGDIAAAINKDKADMGPVALSIDKMTEAIKPRPLDVRPIGEAIALSVAGAIERMASQNKRILDAHEVNIDKLVKVVEAQGQMIVDLLAELARAKGEPTTFKIVRGADGLAAEIRKS
jgi:hypothetical protein